MEYDVLVVGAGPAGSTAARACAENGLSVAVLDRAEFPRDKPCGGGVNLRAARLLPFDLSPVTERVIRGMGISTRMGPVDVRWSEQPLTYLTQRRNLDAFLLERARGVGAAVFERRAVRGVERDGARVTVRAGNETFVGRTLVAADGANGPTARLAGLPVQRWLAVALEGNAALPDRPESAWREAFAIDVATMPGGYGWLFPKGDHVNLGVGGAHYAGPSLRYRLDQVTRYYGFDPAALWGVRGHPLPFRRKGSPVTDRNVVAVGDAAGLVDPLSGEGIYSAVWSGTRAAEHITRYLGGETDDLTGYARDVEETLDPELVVAGRVRDLLQLMPSAGSALVLRSSHAWSLVCDLIRGDQTYASVAARHPVLSIPLGLLSDSVRLGLRTMKWDERGNLPDPEFLVPLHV